MLRAPKVPRPDARRWRTLPDHGPVEVPRPETILGVERPSDDQHGRLYVVAGPAQVARLPPCVVGGVFGKLFPERIGTLKFRKFGQRRMFPEERPLVGAGPLRHRGHLFGRSMARRGVHAAQETVGVGEHQHAVVADVVAHEPVGDRSLRRNGLHRRMGAETAHHGVEARIGTAGRNLPCRCCAAHVSRATRPYRSCPSSRPFRRIPRRTWTNSPSLIKRPRTSCMTTI